MVKLVSKIAFITGIAALLYGLVFLEQEKILLESELALQSFGGNFWITAAAFYLSAFMAVLLVRFIAMVVCSFLEFLRSAPEPVAAASARDDERLPRVTVVVPAYNESLVIGPALRSLLALDYPNYEVLIVDDGSTDDTYQKAVEASRESDTVPVRVISKRNGGKADALNTGMAHASGEFIFNMDGDTRLSRNCLRACVRHFDDPAIGAVAGNVKVGNRENILTRLQAIEYIEGLAMVRKAQSYFHAVSIVPGPAGMFRRSALMQVRGYDSDTFAEDCDVTLKLLLAGWQVRYEPAAVATVETPSRTLNLIKQRYRWTRGMLQAVRKHRLVLRRPGKRWTGFFLLLQTLFETVVWPLSNVAGNLFFVYIGFQHGLAVYLLYWWLQLTLLDIVAATYCIVMEEEDGSLLLYAPLFRIFYLLTLDVAKVLAACEELFRIDMSWGKLEREGKL